MLIKSGRREGLPYVHAGWIAALALGGVTWVVASYVVTVSGAAARSPRASPRWCRRDVLLYVGFWMHRHSHAARWKAFIETRVRAALSGRTLWALASISFLAGLSRGVRDRAVLPGSLVETGPGGHLAVGLGCVAGFVGLGLLAWLILRLGLRLPVGWFFGVGSALMAVLAVVLAGKGIAALQHAGQAAGGDARSAHDPLAGRLPDVAGRDHPARAGRGDPGRVHLLAPRHA